MLEQAGNSGNPEKTQNEQAICRQEKHASHVGQGSQKAAEQCSRRRR